MWNHSVTCLKKKKLQRYSYAAAVAIVITFHQKTHCRQQAEAGNPFHHVYNFASWFILVVNILQASVKVIDY